MKSKTRIRTYVSPLRADQVEHTRERLLDALQARLRAGDRTLAYASIAREAKVSLPTLYRHFPSRNELFEAFAVRERARHGHTTLPQTVPELRATIRRAFETWGSTPESPGYPGRVNAVFELSRIGTVPPRRAMLGHLLDTEAPGLPPREREALIDMGIVFMSSVMAEALQGYLELAGPPLAERMILAFDMLLEHARRLAEAAGRGELP